MTKRTKRTKRVPIEIKTTIADAVSAAFGDLQGLGEEMREAYDNTPENLQQSGVGEARGEAADALENLTEPDVPERLGATEFKYVTKPLPMSASRSHRRDDAVMVLCFVKDHLEGLELTEDDETERDDLISAIDDLISEADAVEFPGMYG